MTEDTCPVCGGQRSHYLHPLLFVWERKRDEQECTTCGLYVEYWPMVAELRDSTETIGETHASHSR